MNLNTFPKDEGPNTPREETLMFITDGLRKDILRNARRILNTEHVNTEELEKLYTILMGLK